MLSSSRVASLILLAQLLSVVQGLRRKSRRTRADLGCCKFGGANVCGDCGTDGGGWCHGSQENCEVGCGGVFDAAASIPECDGNVPSLPTPAPTPRPPSPPLEGNTPVQRHGKLAVSGNRIVGEHGGPVRFRGMSMFWSQWEGEFWNQNMLRWLIRDWHLPMIRLAMGVDNDGGYMESPETKAAEKAKLMTMVDAAIAEGIYAVIDWHDHYAHEHQAEAIAFFDEMAQRYGGFPNVLFEPFNEPLSSHSWADTIKPYHEAVVPVIRRYTDNIIILGTRSWGQEVDEASLNPVTGYANLAYTFHFYANTHKQAIRNKVITALGNGIAIFATEWGTCDATGNGDLNLEETQAWHDFFDQNWISDANWAIGDKDEACAAMKPGAAPGGGWPEANLTESGLFVRQQIRSDESAFAYGE